MAGGNKSGMVYRAANEIGFHAVQYRHCVTDIHLTLLHPLGLDPKRLEVVREDRVCA